METEDSQKKRTAGGEDSRQGRIFGIKRKLVGENSRQKRRIGGNSKWKIGKERLSLEEESR